MKLIVLKVGDVNTTQFVLAEADGEVGSGVGKDMGQRCTYACSQRSTVKFLCIWNWFCDKVLKVEAGKKNVNFVNGIGLQQ